MARYIGVELPILIVGVAVMVGLVVAGGVRYIAFVIVPFAFSGAICLSLHEATEAQGRR